MDTFTLHSGYQVSGPRFEGETPSIRNRYVTCSAATLHLLCLKTCSCPAHHKSTWDNGGTAPPLSMATLDGMSGQLHAWLQYLWKRATGYHWKWWVGGLHNPFGCSGYEVFLIHLPHISSKTVLVLYTWKNDVSWAIQFQFIPSEPHTISLRSTLTVSGYD
jgi:hypothetical protein